MQNASKEAIMTGAEKLNIGIVGIGRVGNILVRWLEKEKKLERGKHLFLFDTDKEKGFQDDVSRAGIIFIVVHTPSREDGSCDLSHVEASLEPFANSSKIIVIKSTVPPDACKYLSEKYDIPFLFLNPETLTEAKPWKDFVEPFLQVVAPVRSGEKYKGIARIILNLLPRLENTHTSVDISTVEASLAKNGINEFAKWKVIFFNKLFDRCKAIGVDFKKVREMITSDPRVGEFWSRTPWPEKNGYRGAGGFCIDKDSLAMQAFDGQILAKKKVWKTVDKCLFKAGMKIDQSIDDYNQQLLASQGLRRKDVTKHEGGNKDDK